MGVHQTNTIMRIIKNEQRFINSIALCALSLLILRTPNHIVLDSILMTVLTVSSIYQIHKIEYWGEDS